MAKNAQPHPAARIARAAAALIAYLAALIAVPTGLYAFGGNPLSGLPALRDLGAILTSPDDGTLFLQALLLAGWAGWASFALPLVWEAVSQITGRRIRRLPGLGPQQRLAAALVSAILAALVSPSLASANATAVAAAPPATVQAMTSTATATPQPQLASHHQQQAILYEVARGDWLAGVAERFLGDRDRYPEIAALNPQYAGHHDSNHERTFPHHIEGKWTLTLPADAYDRGPGRRATGTVLTPAVSTPATQNPAQPPATGGPGTETSPSPAPSVSATPSPAQSPSTPPSQATPAPATTQAPSAQPGAEDADNVGVIVAVSGFAAATLLVALVLAMVKRRRVRQQQHRRAGRRLATPANRVPEVAARAAANPADVARLDLALRAMTRALINRTPVELPDIAAAWLAPDSLAFILTRPCPPPSPFTAAGEGAWALAAEEDLTDVDADEHLSPVPALMTLASHPAEDPSDRVHLLVDAERAGILTLTGDPARCQDLLRYLAAETAASSWGDDATVLLAGLAPQDTANLIALNDGRVRGATAPAEALARFGRRAQAAMQALHDAGAVDAVDGRINHSQGQTWSPQVLFLSDLQDRHATELAALDTQLKDLPRCCTTIVAITNTPTTWSVHVGADGTLTLPWLGTRPVTASQLSATQLAELADTVTKARPRLSRTVFDHVPDDPDSFDQFDEPVPAAEEDWAAHTDKHGHLLAAISDAFADPQPAATDDGDQHGAGHTPYEKVEIFNQANGYDHLAAAAARAPRPLPDDPSLDDDLAAWHAAGCKDRPRIGVLGPVTVDAPGFIPDERVRFYQEIVVFLVQRGQRGATADEIISNLWIDEQIRRNSVRVALSRVRRWLGENDSQQPWMPGNSGEAPYRLRDGYLLDWTLFRRLRARGEAKGNAGVTDLRAALDLVRGAPLEGAEQRQGSKRTPYPWLANSEIPPYHLTAAIVDTAHELVGLCLQSGDVEGARWAVDKAWIADPARTDDHPWQDRMRIAAAEGKHAELRALLSDLMQEREAEALVDLSKSTYAVVLELGLDTLLQDA